MKTNALRWINAALFAAMVAVNALANMLPIGGNTTGEVSAAYPNLFTPAAVTFAIWGIIYLLMAFFTIYQLDISGRSEHSLMVRNKIGIWFAVSCLLNIIWIFLWHNRKTGLSVLCIAALLLSLIIISQKLKALDSEYRFRRLLQAGFDIYLGWIIIATIANISVWLVSMGLSGFGLLFMLWTIIMLLAGAAIANFMVSKWQKWFSALAMIWAYIGILIRQISAAGYDCRYTSIILAVCAGIMIILWGMISEIRRK
ncbi:MAG: tryptophan-rich sensory protein [Spirochaetia bacterium]|nr:tryptophan-rich sensory protein [Spirochaetia bacterium]